MSNSFHPKEAHMTSLTAFLLTLILDPTTKVVKESQDLAIVTTEMLLYKKIVATSMMMVVLTTMAIMNMFSAQTLDRITTEKTISSLLIRMVIMITMKNFKRRKKLMLSS